MEFVESDDGGRLLEPTNQPVGYIAVSRKN